MAKFYGWHLIPGDGKLMSWPGSKRLKVVPGEKITVGNDSEIRVCCHGLHLCPTLLDAYLCRLQISHEFDDHRLCRVIGSGDYDMNYEDEILHKLAFRNRRCVWMLSKKETTRVIGEFLLGSDDYVVRFYGRKFLVQGMNPDASVFTNMIWSDKDPRRFERLAHEAYKRQQKRAA